MKNIIREIYVADEIRYKIETGEMNPHDKLPSERELCKIFNSERSTIRLALKSLKQEGWIYSKERSGYYVAEPHIKETLNITSSMSGEVETLGKKIYRKTIHLREIESNKKLLKRMGVPIGTKLYEFERIRYIDEEAISIETTYFEAEDFNGLLDKDLSNNPLLSTLEKEYKVKFVKGEQEIKIVYANKVESQYLGVPENSPLVLRRGLLFTKREEYRSFHESVMCMNRFVYIDEE